MIMYNYANGDALVSTASYSIPSIHITKEEWDGRYDNGMAGYGLSDWLAKGNYHMLTISGTTIERTIDPERADWLAAFSSRGPSPSTPEALIPAVAAPGVSIYAAFADEHPFSGSPASGDFAFLNGTSMASPHVAGAAALLWSVNPDITALEMKAILMDSGDSLPALDGKTVSGKRLNLSSAMVEADPTPSFKLSISPRTQQITAGDAAQYTLDVGNIAEWTGEVALTVDVEPALDGVSLSASTAQPGDTVTLDVATSADTDWGSYQFTVTGVDSATGELVKSVNASLNILPQGLQDYSFSNNTAVAIPDNDAAGIESVINVPQTGVVFGTDVGVNITHTWRGDLIVKLRSPEGTEHMLHNRTGGSADDLIQNWQVTSFNDESMQGNWTLVVSDNAGLDTGTLNSWTLTLSALSDDDTPPGPVAPVADFSFVASGLTVNFTDLSTDADNDISSWSWDFGDGNSATEADVSHSYLAPGSYNVSLTATDSTGLSHTVAKTVAVSDTNLDLMLQRSVRTRTGSTIVDLRWTGTSDSVDLYRDGQLIDTVENNGRYRDRFNSQATSISYKICLAGTANCSAELTVNF